MSELSLFIEEFDPDGEFEVTAVISREMEDEWLDAIGKVNDFYTATSEKSLLQMLREFKEQVAEWPG